MACPTAIPSATRMRPSAPRGGLLGERALPRVAISFPARVHFDGGVAPHYARVRDLSVAGVGIEMPLRLSLEEIRGVTLSTPTGRIDLVAEGCWQEELAAVDAFSAGIRFLDVEGIALNQLWDVVQRQVRTLTKWFSQVRELRDLSLDDTLELIHLMRLRVIAEGGVLYRQAVRSPCEDSIFIVTSGEVTLDTWTADGRRVALGLAGPGEVLGGLALIANAPADESASVMRDTSVLELAPAAFEMLKNSHPGLAFEAAAAVMRSHLGRRASQLERLQNADSCARSSDTISFPIPREGVLR